MKEALTIIGMACVIFAWVAAAMFALAWATLFPSLGLMWLFGWLA